MKIRNVILSTLASTVALLGTGTAVHAGDIVRISGRTTDKVVAMDVAFGQPGPGHFAYRATTKGIVRAGGDPLFDGADRTVQANWDVDRGAGRGAGYTTVTKDGDSFTSEWSGVCSTLPGKDGKPSTLCAGGWVILTGTGTGRFAGIQGGGSWSGTVLPDGSFDGGFEGQYMR